MSDTIGLKIGVEGECEIKKHSQIALCGGEIGYAGNGINTLFDRYSEQFVQNIRRFLFLNLTISRTLDFFDKLWYNAIASSVLY